MVEAKKFANKVGLNIDLKSLDLTSSLGSLEDSLINITSAYASIINDGSRARPNSISKIEDENDSTIIFIKPGKRQMP